MNASSNTIVRGSCMLFCALASILVTASCAGQVRRCNERTPPGGAVDAAHRVFDDIVRAIDDPALPPRLEVADDLLVSPAGYLPGERIVRIDRRICELCGTFGKDSLNALASILGHELAHCYRGFRTVRELGVELYHVTMRKITDESSVSDETEADLFGGFYARIAGYDATRLTPAVLEKVYEVFQLPKEDAHGDYLPMTRRKTVAVNADAELSRLLPVFDAATYLTLARMYPQAQQCYDFVSRVFPSRELYNNAGVVYALQALKIMGDEDVRFIYPLELDADSRLRGTDVLNGRIERGTRSPTASDSVLIVRLLDSARERFLCAHRKDTTYAPALINLATVAILHHRYREAIDLTNAATALDDCIVTRVLGAIVKSIALARLERPDEARAGLQLVRDAAGDLDEKTVVEANLAVLEKRDYTISAGQGTGSAGELVGGFRGDDTSVSTSSPRVQAVGGGSSLRIMSRGLPDCSVVRVQGDSSWAQFIWTADWYEGASKKGIRIGSAGEKVLKLYGDKPRVVHARQGDFYIYEYSKLIFLIGPEGKVVKWAVYGVG